MSSLVTIYRTRSPIEAQVVRSALESLGIGCHLEGERQAAYTGLFDIALVVNLEDADVARKALQEFHQQADSDLNTPDSVAPEAGELDSD